jgi:hypothetical protein
MITFAIYDRAMCGQVLQPEEVTAIQGEAAYGLGRT